MSSTKKRLPLGYLKPWEALLFAVGGLVALALFSQGLFFAAGAPFNNSEPTPVEVIENQLTAEELLSLHGAGNVEVVYTSDPQVNCGAAKADSGHGGCFRSETPETIYVSPELMGDSLKYVVLHELAHVRQFSAGVPLDECEADVNAFTWGANEAISGYNCLDGKLPD